MVELRDKGEQEAEAESIKDKQADEEEAVEASVEPTSTLDDTPNLRSCIVNHEGQPDNFETLTVDIIKLTV